MIRSEKERALTLQQFRFVNDDLSAKDANSNAGNDLENAVKQDGESLIVKLKAHQ